MYIYKESKIQCEKSTLYIAKENNNKFLIVSGAGRVFDELQGETDGKEVKRCPLTTTNAAVIRTMFPFTNPVSHKSRKCTIGLGDRLGLSSPGHLRVLSGTDIFPVLAQQSIRELNLTHRTYEDVLSAAVWAVFQEGYKGGYGADGDHLKTRDEVNMALSCGFSMITLDCSEHIPDGLEAVAAFAVDIYNEFIRSTDIDFELSIDETQTVTTVDDHRFLAEALKRADVHPVSVAPRFPGEFQKGIDYRGDLVEFENAFREHVQIAEEYGYKLSIHSGSDKFAVFPIIYRETGCKVHIKTAGTHWLEALRVIAAVEPSLFRLIMAVGLERLSDAKQFYHITENAANIPDLNALADSELVSLLDNDDARQVLHITYGYTLDAYKAEIYDVLSCNENAYYEGLEKHLKRHLP